MAGNPIGHNSKLLFLSCATGQHVVAPDGEAFGRIADLSVDLAQHPEPHLVERILIRRRRRPDILLPWSAIESFSQARVVVREGFEPAAFTVGSVPESLGRQEILLVRDVLDTQILDVVGQRLTRVADVVLSSTLAGRLDLVGVEVGFGGVLRRLGLAGLASQTRQDVVAWTDLHLTSERGHAVQLDAPRSAVHHLDATGLAILVDRLDTESATEVLVATGPQAAAGAIRVADAAVGERMLRAMPENDAAQIMAAMTTEHASRWRVRLDRTPALPGRRFLRSGVWPRRRHATSTDAR